MVETRLLVKLTKEVTSMFGVTSNESPVICECMVKEMDKQGKRWNVTKLYFANEAALELIKGEGFPDDD